MTGPLVESLQITYLLANYNNGQYISDCIRSLQAQTNPHWQCLIIDDQSSDSSLEIIQPFLCAKIRLLRNEQNLGYIRTLIHLIENATTDIVGILDPDDALYPEATEFILKAYQENPETGFVYTNYGCFNEDLSMQTKVGLGHAIPAGKTSLLGGFVSHLKTFRRSAYFKTARYDPDILYAEDRDLVFKMEEVTPLFFIDKVLYKYRFVSNSQSRDAAKRSVGDRNHRRAYKNALNRRRITGRERVLHLLWFNSQRLAKKVENHLLLLWIVRYSLQSCVSLIMKLNRFP